MGGIIEYNFPLHIPSQYHKYRYPVTLKKEQRRPLKGTKSFFSHQADRVTAFIGKELQIPMAEKRVFLYLLHNRLGEGDKKLEPQIAKKIHEKTQAIYIKTKKELKSGASGHGSLDLPTSAAIEQVLDLSPSMVFSIESTDRANLNMHNLVALLRHENISEVLIEQKDDNDYDGLLSEFRLFTHCSLLGKSFMHEKPGDLEVLLDAASRRKKPMIIKIDYLLERCHRDILTRIEKKTKGMVKFKFKRRVYETASEGVDYGYEEADFWEHRATLDPQRFCIKDILERYNEKKQEVSGKVYDFVNDLEKRFSKLSEEEIDTVSLSSILDRVEQNMDEDESELETRSDLCHAIFNDFQCLIDDISKLLDDIENHFEIESVDSYDEVDYSKETQEAIDDFKEKVMVFLQESEEKIIAWTNSQCDEFKLTDQTDSDLENHLYDSDDDDYDSDKEPYVHDKLVIREDKKRSQAANEGASHKVARKRHMAKHRG